MRLFPYAAIAAMTVAGCAVIGCQSNGDPNAPFTSGNTTYYAAANSVTTAENVTMALLAAHKITPAQAQQVADQCKATRLAIAAAESASAPAGSAAVVSQAVAGLQAYISELSK